MKLSETDRLSFSSRLLPRISLLLLAAALLSACAGQFINRPPLVAAPTTINREPIKLSVATCRESLSRPVFDQMHELDPRSIRLVNWNIQKKSSPEWERDFDALVDGKELVLIQEASLRTGTNNERNSRSYRSFAPGYRRNGEITGVLTLSSIEPMTQCSFVIQEPVLRTPKATSVTQFSLSTTDNTLVVVNVHAVNFSLGLAAFREQFERIAEVLSEHQGPIILAGDFNTWRVARMVLIEELTARLGLQPLQFEEDHRVRSFGQPLDHIYVRGLSAVVASTREVTTSDHNPMSATLSM